MLLVGGPVHPLSSIPLVLLPEDRSQLAATMLLDTFDSLFMLPETAWLFCTGFLPPEHWPPGLPVFLFPRISSFLALCFFPLMWAPKLNSVTQSTLQILHQKEGTTFGLGHCKIWEGRCGTLTFFLMGYQLAVCLCTAELKLDCCWGTVLSGANFLLKSSDIESVPTSWNLKYFLHNQN